MGGSDYRTTGVDAGEAHGYENPVSIVCAWSAHSQLGSSATYMSVLYMSVMGI